VKIEGEIEVPAKALAKDVPVGSTFEVEIEFKAPE